MLSSTFIPNFAALFYEFTLLVAPIDYGKKKNTSLSLSLSLSDTSESNSHSKERKIKKHKKRKKGFNVICILCSFKFARPLYKRIFRPFEICCFGRKGICCKCAYKYFSPLQSSIPPQNMELELATHIPNASLSDHHLQLAKKKKKKKKNSKNSKEEEEEEKEEEKKEEHPRGYAEDSHTTDMTVFFFLSLLRFVSSRLQRHACATAVSRPGHAGKTKREREKEKKKTRPYFENIGFKCGANPSAKSGIISETRIDEWRVEYYPYFDCQRVFPRET